MLLFGLKAGLILSLFQSLSCVLFLLTVILRTINVSRLRSLAPVLIGAGHPMFDPVFSPPKQVELLEQHAAWMAGAKRWALISLVLMALTGIALLWIVVVKSPVEDLFLSLRYEDVDSVLFEGFSFKFFQGLLLLALLYFAGVGVSKTLYNL